MEGPVFRKLTVAERNEIVPRLQVSPFVVLSRDSRLTSFAGTRPILARRQEDPRRTSQSDGRSRWCYRRRNQRRTRPQDCKRWILVRSSRSPLRSALTRLAQYGNCWNRSRQGGFRYHPHGRQLLEHRLRDHVGSMCQRFGQEVPSSEFFVLASFCSRLISFRSSKSPSTSPLSLSPSSPPSLRLTRNPFLPPSSCFGSI